MSNLSLINESGLFAECFKKLERIGDNTFECVIWERPQNKTTGKYKLIENASRASYAFVGNTPLEAMDEAYRWLCERHGVII